MKKGKLIICKSDEYPLDPFEKEDIFKGDHEWIFLIKDWKIPALTFVIIFAFVASITHFLGVRLSLSSQRYLLSSIFQGLAAIFALGMTGMIVGVQILNNKYSYRGIKYLPKSAWNIFRYTAVYVLSLVMTLIFLYYLNEDTLSQYYLISYIEIALSGTLIFYTGIKIWNMIILLDPTLFFKAIYNEIMERKMKDKNYINQNHLDIMEMFSEIILKSLETQQELIAAEGIKTLTYTFLDEIAISTNEGNKKCYFMDIYTKYSQQVELFTKVAVEKGELNVLNELVNVMCRIAVTAFKNKCYLNNFCKGKVFPLVKATVENIIDFRNRSNSSEFGYEYFMIKCLTDVHMAVSFMLGQLLRDKGYSSDCIKILIFALGNNLEKIESEKVYESNFRYAELIVGELSRLLNEILSKQELFLKLEEDISDIVGQVIFPLSKFIATLCNMQKYSNNGIGIFKNLWNLFEKHKKDMEIEKHGDFLTFVKINFLLMTTDKLLGDELLKDDNSLNSSECLSLMADKFLELYFKFGKNFETIINKLNLEKRKAIAKHILFKNYLPRDAKEYFNNILQNEGKT